MLCAFGDARVVLCYLNQRGNYSGTIEIRTFSNPAHLPCQCQDRAADILSRWAQGTNWTTRLEVEVKEADLESRIPLTRYLSTLGACGPQVGTENARRTN